MPMCVGWDATRHHDHLKDKYTLLVSYLPTTTKLSAPTLAAHSFPYSEMIDGKKTDLHSSFAKKMR